MPKLAELGRRLKPMIGNRLQAQQIRQQQASKPSQQPGYRIRGREGQRIRAEHLRAYPLCAHCMAKGTITPAAEVDHVIALANGGRDTGDNRQSLCRPCHRIKSATEPRRDSGGGVHAKS